MSEFTHTHIDTNGIKMHVVEAGRGFPVLPLIFPSTSFIHWPHVGLSV